MSIERLLPAVLACLLMSACAFTEYGNRINGEQLAISRLEAKRHKLETQYIIILNSLELNPLEPALALERNTVHKKLQELVFDIDEKRKMFDQSLMEWEQKIVSDKIEKEMEEKEIRENADKDEHLDFEGK